MALTIKAYNFSHGVHPKPDHSFRNVDTLLEPYLVRAESQLVIRHRNTKVGSIASIIIATKNEMI
jgi:hypothetical protein